MLIFLIYMILYTGCHSKLVGTVNKTQFTSLDRLNSESIWISNQYSPKQCLCTVLSQYTNVLLFNSYLNGSCQLFLSLPYTYKMEYNSNSTLILLSPLPPVTQAPCCSNLTWLIKRLQNSSFSPISLYRPTFLVIDDLDYLAVLLYGTQLYRYNRTTMTLNGSYSIGSLCSAVSYYNKQYFISCGTNNPSKLYVLSTATLASITNITVLGDPRDVVFIRNGTMMIVSFATINQLGFYNVISSTSYTLNSTINVPGQPYSFYRVNDTFLYVTTFGAFTAVYRLTYSSTTNDWSLNSIPTIISPNSSSTFFQTTFDACGRMWISIRGYGIRIFDSTGTISLYNWTVASGLNGIALTKNFDLYAADFLNGKLLSYQPGISQCTS